MSHIMTGINQSVDEANTYLNVSSSKMGFAGRVSRGTRPGPRGVYMLLIYVRGSCICCVNLYSYGAWREDRFPNGELPVGTRCLGSIPGFANESRRVPCVSRFSSEVVNGKLRGSCRKLDKFQVIIDPLNCLLYSWYVKRIYILLLDEILNKSKDFMSKYFLRKRYFASIVHAISKLFSAKWNSTCYIVHSTAIGTR